MTVVTKYINQHQSKSALRLLVLGMIVSILGGCSGISLSTGSLFGDSSSSNTAQSGQQAQPVNASAPARPAAPIAFAPVFGPPSKVAKSLSGALASQAQGRNLNVVTTSSSPEYTVRGYLSASPDKNGTKLSYIWDVTNRAGKRAHRIKGEEIVRGPQNTRDPWALVDQNAIKTIANKTTARLANWLPGGGGGLVQQASLRGSASGSTGAGPSEVVAVIPAVQGAPGDGSKTLANALRQQLSNRGIKISSVGRVSNPYKVIGIVNLASAGNNQQNIKIQWIVKDPRNKKLGTVTQKNTIPAGSLDGSWGGTADAAAAAAAQGIAKLLQN